jgi:hypothetical protein
LGLPWLPTATGPYFRPTSPLNAAEGLGVLPYSQAFFPHDASIREIAVAA